MWRKKLCVPAGALAQFIAGDVPSPAATPGAAWLNLTGIRPPSGNPEMVRVIADEAGPPLVAPPCADSRTVMESVIASKRTNCMRISYRETPGAGQQVRKLIRPLCVVCVRLRR